MRHLRSLFAVSALVVGTASSAQAAPWRYLEPRIANRPPIGANGNDYRFNDGLYAVTTSIRYWDLPLSLGGVNSPGVTNYSRTVQIRALIWGHSTQEKICVWAFVHSNTGADLASAVQCSSDADSGLVWKSLDVTVPEGGTVHVVAELFGTTYTSFSGHWYSLAYNDPFLP